jgi:hypothetical protein
MVVEENANGTVVHALAVEENVRVAVGRALVVEAIARDTEKGALTAVENSKLRD